MTLAVARGRRKLRGTLKTAAKPGVNAVRLTGRLGGRALAPGRYTLRLRATPAGGGKPARATVRFRVVR